MITIRSGLPPMATRPIDVLIPVYNGAQTIRTSLASIQTQTVQNIRIFVVNDGSTDETAEIVKNIAREDSRIYLVDKQNSGIVDTLNTGLQYCDAEFIARLDADDLSFPQRLEVQLAYLRENEDCIAVGCRIEHIDEAGHLLSNLPQPGQPDAADPCWVPAREPYLMHPFLMVRRSAMIKVGAYRHVVNSEDTDLYWRLIEHGRLYNLDISLGQYRMHPTSISGTSIIGGRIMAVNSQRAALSAIRRRQGRQDLDFANSKKATLESRTLEELYDLSCSDLDDEERAHLAIAASAKLLELASYRPYELEYSDCVFIRKSLSEAFRLSKQNQKELNWLVTVAAARLLRGARLVQAATLAPASAYPIVMARLLCGFGRKS
jgi:glycosyltransferase involved in cell wall biosynthesis